MERQRKKVVWGGNHKRPRRKVPLKGKKREERRKEKGHRGEGGHHAKLNLKAGGKGELPVLGKGRKAGIKNSTGRAAKGGGKKNLSAESSGGKGTGGK